MHTAIHDPLMPSAPHGTINTRRVMRCKGRITRMRPLSHDTYEVVVATTDGCPTMQARAGQFATLAVPGVHHPRPYSFACDPRRERPGEYTFFIRLVPGGEMSSWLAARDRTGDSVEIAGPMGAFTLDDSALPMVLLAGGSGMSAVKALAEEASRRRLGRDCLFLYGARSQRDLYAQAEVAALMTAWAPDKRLHLVTVLSDEPADSAWDGPRGLVTDYFRANYLGQGPWQPGHFKAWLCGPPPMVEAAAAILQGHGTPSSHVYCDVFADARSPAPVIDNRRCVLCDECLLVKPVADCIVETDMRAPSTATRSRGHASLIKPAHTAGLYYNSLVVDEDRCIRCYACIKACPHDAIRPRAPANPASRRSTGGSGFDGE
jgi:NAD(P)H-flavin reductase